MTVRSLISVGVSLALVACGGGGGGDGGSDTQPVAKTAIQGKAIDGYVQGATTYLDLNFNRRLDEGEPNAVTSNTGDYRLELTEAQQECAQYVPLVVDVPVGAVDLDLGPVEQAYQMVLPPKFKPLTQDDFYHVTPLTTALWSSVEKELAAGGALTCQSVMADQQKREQLMNSLEQAVNRMVYHYNISEQKIYEDFIATGDSELSTKAQEIVRGLQKSFSASEELKRAHPDAFYAYVDYHQGDYRDNDNAYPQAWYRDQGIYWATKSQTELVKVSDDFSQDIRVLGYSETTNVAGNGYSYSNGYGFESRGGDDAPYTCDIKETVSTTAYGKKYELVNLANGEAQVFADCVPEDLAGAITHRYATVGYKDAEADYSSQFVYFLDGSNSFPFLNDWAGMAEDHATRNMNELVTAFEKLPYRYDDKTPEPDAGAWSKKQTVTDSNKVTTTISYDNQGRYRKFTVFADGTHKEECGTDGVVWGTCNQ
ncbi:hypothetical protein [Aeromonas sp. ARM81]|uniref:hypothetical protein n=1 Tax=Aeromonas sp. ARM81 TaxID=1747384 RepID=UPI000DF7E571|nr:hypothetical protein [Aeromonas sp. ARM81]RDD49938.1 hypothetical protein ASJ36_11465 [Aeromonas sp. ARM81]